VYEFLNALVYNVHCVPKSDTKIEITITTTNLIRIKYPLNTLIIAFLAQTLQISTKSTTEFLSNSCLKQEGQHPLTGQRAAKVSSGG